MDVIQKLVDALKLDKTQAEGAVGLLKEGAAVPFIARYRKERTGGLDETKLWALKERFEQLAEFEQRREVVLKALGAADKLTPELKAKLESTESRHEIEDVFMPFRSRRRTRSNAAKAKGLEPLAELILKQETAPHPTLSPEGRGETTVTAPLPALSPEGRGETTATAPLPALSPEGRGETTAAEELVKPFVNAEKGVKDAAEALAGARDVIAEGLAEDAACRKIVRDLLLAEGKIVTKPREGIDAGKGRFAPVAQLSESVTAIPSHKLHAALHGATEKQLVFSIEAPKEKTLAELKAKICANPDATFKSELALAVEECYTRLLGPALDNELRLELKRRADLEAVDTFARHLRAMLLQTPFGAKPVLAILGSITQPWRVSALDGGGKVVAGLNAQPSKSEEEKKTVGEALLKLLNEHKSEAIAIGNGVGSREVDVFMRELLKAHNLTQIPRIVIHDGASAVYAASALAREELPGMDSAMRTAVSLGRRLQDPLAELLKAELCSIGLGQFQHDVDQKLLEERLEQVAASCVAHVGVDALTAGAPLLRHVAGLNAELAKTVIDARTKLEGFKSRDSLRAVLDVKVWEQCIAFLRVPNDAQPLDATAVHPECYATAAAMAAAAGVGVKELLGNAEALGKLELAKFKTEQIGEPTLKDIFAELAHPGKDPRGAFVKPEINEELGELKDLKDGMVLSGVVTNLAAFGAFVDIGVHQDGLVHISAITHKFIRDPAEVLTVGQHVKVKVLTVDAAKNRVSLSMKALEPAPERPRPAVRPPLRARPAGAQAATSAAPGQAGTPPRESRPPRRFDRPRRTAGVSPASAAPAGTTPAVQAANGPAGMLAPDAIHGGKPGAQRFDRNRPPRRDDGRDRRREPEKKVEPGKPDYAKFYVKGKRKERDKDRKGQRFEGGASRDEVRQVLRNQDSGGTSLGDLLRKAGVSGEENVS